MAAADAPASLLGIYTLGLTCVTPGLIFMNIH